MIPSGYEKPRYNEDEIKTKDKSNAGIGVTSMSASPKY